jgi:SAM-dependent methyltransferase
MNSPLNSRHFKYDRSPEEWEECVADPTRQRLAATWLAQERTFDRWRHDRMLVRLLPFIEADCNASWVTIGDGRYGTDANALFRLGANNVHCTDFSDRLLRIGFERGFIRDYSAQNAESLLFDDGSFDYVLCKEAYHHFPRPHIAIHEMFRVARRAVIMIEPRDRSIDAPIFSRLRRTLGYFIGKNADGYAFEPVGNFVFSLSERECEKILLGMNYQAIAFSSINDVYEQNVEFLRLDTEDHAEKRKLLKLKSKLAFKDVLSRLGICQSGLLMAALFKSEPDPALLGAMSNRGWLVKSLPLNPYR